MIEEAKVRAMLQKVRAIELKTRKTTSNSLTGSYHSVFKGQGVNFEEIRAYIPGDEVRFIDWNSSAKLGQPFIKIFREERELTLLLAIDVSGSTACGTAGQSKREFATEIAGTLAFSALKNNDKVGLILFSDRVEKYIPPQKGRRQLLRLIREALFFKPENEATNLNACLEQIGQMIKKKAIVCLISDFIHSKEDVPAKTIKNLARLCHHHDLICFRIEDPREKTLPDVGLIALEDAETHETFYLDTHSEKLRRKFSEKRAQIRSEFQNLCQKQGVECLSLLNGQPYVTALEKLFKQRNHY